MKLRSAACQPLRRYTAEIGCIAIPYAGIGIHRLLLPSGLFERESIEKPDLVAPGHRAGKTLSVEKGVGSTDRFVPSFAIDLHPQTSVKRVDLSSLSCESRDRLVDPNVRIVVPSGLAVR